MPGVPNGRGCDACRQQKKKCDQAKPACSRCARLSIKCIGAGQLRYQFKQYNGTKKESPRERSSSAETDSQPDISKLTISTSPHNEVDGVVTALVHAIEPTMGVRFNLAWTYGDIFQDLPQRLGRNKALDASIAALTSAHSDFCMRRSQLSARTLQAHGLALSNVRVCLNDPSVAAMPETLCAVYLLLICQAFVGSGDGSFSSHTEGAAHILKARGKRYIHDEFERKLLLTIRGPVIFDAIFNTNIDISPLEWDALLRNDWEYMGWEGQLLRCLAAVPGYLQRGRAVKRGKKDMLLMHELQNHYEVMKLATDRSRDRLMKMNDMRTAANLELVHLVRKRIYGLNLFVSMILNCILTALRHPYPSLATDIAYFVSETIELAETSHVYRPLGSSYIFLNLLGAYAGHIDSGTRARILELINNYRTDFPTPNSSVSMKDLENATKRLRLQAD